MNGKRKSRVGSGGHAGGVDRLHPAMRSHMWKAATRPGIGSSPDSPVEEARFEPSVPQRSEASRRGLIIHHTFYERAAL